MGNIRLNGPNVITQKIQAGTKNRWTFTLLALLVTACAGRAGESGQEQPPAVPARPLFTAPLAGEKIAVLPLTMIIAEPPLNASGVFLDRSKALHWADSSLSEALSGRAPDINWVLPEELRAIARRAPTVAPDPDKMGQSVMAAPRLDFLPDPLRSYARSLVAIAGGRHLLIPAAYTFTPAGDGTLKAELAIVLADARNGRVIWRTLAVGQGASADLAIGEALRTMLPLPTGSE
jgi:hypothetical protein